MLSTHSAAIWLALYIRVQASGVAPEQLRAQYRTYPQEYVERGTYIYPPAASMRLITTFPLRKIRVPRWNHDQH